MAKVFEDEFVDLQAGFVSLCFELVGDSVDEMFIYLSNEEKVYSFNAFFKKDGEIKTMGKMNLPGNLVKQFLRLGTGDIEKIRELCKQHDRPAPRELKLHYDVRTRKFEAKYKYEPVCTEETGVWSTNVFMDWVAEERARAGQ